MLRSFLDRQCAGTQIVDDGRTLSGAESTPRTRTRSGRFPGYRNVHVGSFATGAVDEVVDLWTDELVIGTSEVPCD